MQFQHADNAEYGLSAVPLRQSASNHHDPHAAWEFSGQVFTPGVHSLHQTCANTRADINPASRHNMESVKPAEETMDCIHQNAPVIDELHAIVAGKYDAEGYNNYAQKNSLRLDGTPLAFLGFQQQLYGALPALRFSSSRNSTENESKPPLQNPEGAPAKDGRNQAFEENKSLALITTLQRENLILSGRQRRSGINQLYAEIRSVLPHIGAPKTGKAGLVTEMIKYIQSLQRRLHVRSKGRHGIISGVKSEPIGSSTKSTQTASSSVCNASVNAHPGTASPATNIAVGEASARNPFGHFTFHCDGNGIFVTLLCEQKENLLPAITLVLESYDLEIMDAFVTTTETVVFNCIHLKAPEIVDPQTTETVKGTLQKLTRSDFQINFPRLSLL